MANNSGAGRALRRYGPIALVVVIASGGGDDDGGGQVRTTSEGDNSLPLTFQEAQAQGIEGDIGWGPDCDTETGRLKVPINNRFPCVEPWQDGADNGGATAQGVTADEITVALYKGQPDPLQQALVEDAGGNTDPNAVNQTALDYLSMLEQVVETYGRTLNVVTVEATGGPADAIAAATDAQKVIDLKPFAAIGGPSQTPAYWQELVNAGIVCVGTCSLAESWDNVEASAPYLWPTGPAPDQADALLAEFVGKQLVGKPAQFAGDPALQSQERVFGWIQAETETGEYTARNNAFDDMLAEYGGEIADRFTYLFVTTSTGDEVAPTAIQRMRDAGVTSIILSTDPFVPKQLTEEAEKQGYTPEWIIGPTVLVDTTFFGRTYQQSQWSRAFGIGLPTARQDNQLQDSWYVYQWWYDREPPVNTQEVIWPGVYRFALGVHLAGPNLTPETFKEGLFRYEPEPGGLTYAYQSWGDKTWGRPDYNSSDDATVIWWDPDAEGESETGVAGTGMLRYVDGGKRYLPGAWPTDPIPIFEEAGSVTVYTELPASDARPDYPPWPGSPAAGG